MSCAIVRGINTLIGVKTCKIRMFKLNWSIGIQVDQPYGKQGFSQPKNKVNPRVKLSLTPKSITTNMPIIEYDHMSYCYSTWTQFLTRPKQFHFQSIWADLPRCKHIVGSTLEKSGNRPPIACARSRRISGRNSLPRTKLLWDIFSIDLKRSAKMWKTSRKSSLWMLSEKTPSRNMFSS